MKKIFVAATRQNDGKTMVSLGLFHALQKRFSDVAYMKPVGQQYLLINGEKIDKDAVLFYNTFGLNHLKLKDMSPIAVPKGFTEAYIENPRPDDIHQKIITAYDALKTGKDFMLFEGTGHAGVGSVFDMSNADAAKLVGSKVLLVVLGGIGRCVDEMMLNLSLFQQKGVEVVGVVINKVLPNKIDKVERLVKNRLKDFNIDVLGVIPLISQLTFPTISSLIDELKPKVLSGIQAKHNSVEKFLIGDMTPHNALDIFSPNTLLIVPGNREGLVLTALCDQMLGDKNQKFISGIIFTNGIAPNQKILSLFENSGIPLLLVQEDSFTIATKINNMIFKIRSEDAVKIQLAESSVRDYVDVDEICRRL